MYNKRFQQIDLNLLRVLSALAEEGSATRAAERLFTTQPAISRSLRKLRDLFGDELFVQTRYGLKPTPIGENLCKVIPSCMNELNQAFDQVDSFCLAEKKDRLRIAINPFLAMYLPAKIHFAIQKQAPGIELEIINWNSLSTEKLLRGELDLAINYSTEIPKDLVASKLIDDSFQLLARNGHPLAGIIATPDMLRDYIITTAIVPGWNEHNTLAQKVFSQYNIKLKLGFRSEIINAVADVTANSDAIFPASSLLPSAKFPGLTNLKLEKSLDIQAAEVNLYFHYRHRNSAYFKWLKEIIQQEVKALAN